MKRFAAGLAIVCMLFISISAAAQTSGFTFATGPVGCSLGGPACNVPVDGGGTVFFRYSANTATINVWINAAGISDAFGPVSATLTQTTTAGTCSVDNRFVLEVPAVTVMDAAGVNWTLSGTQYLSQYRTSGSGRGGGGAGCHYQALGNGFFVLTQVSQ